MQRYKNISEVEIGNKVIMNNTIGIFKNLPRVLLVGEVKEVLDDINLLVAYQTNLHSEQIEIETPFFLLQ